VVAITLLDALAGSAAIYFLVMLLVYTSGPFDVFKRFRRLIGIETVNVYDEKGNVVGEEEESDGSFLAGVFSCHRCATPYVAVVVVAIWIFFPYIVYGLGVMGAAVWMAETSKT